MSYSNVVLVAAFALAACAPPAPSPTPKEPTARKAPATVSLDVQASPTAQGRRVLVVANQNDPESIRLAGYYANKRGVPKENVLLVQTVTTERIPMPQYEKEIRDPVKAALAKSRNPIDFILMVRGLPLRNAEAFGNAIDSLLMADGMPVQKLDAGGRTEDIVPNPYFGKSEPFTRRKFGFCLVCRLDGYTFEDARRLVDNAMASKANPGPFLLDKATNRAQESYGEVQGGLDKAAALLKAKGLNVVLDGERAFAASTAPLAGYASWGSNDDAYKPEVYTALKFLPGAICETFVSTSGRSLRKPIPAGQSAIGELIAQGVTGVKGYVTEPFTLAMARADILFDRYTSGYTLAESFYAASPVTHWKDVVIGDPICAPYKK